MRKYLVQWAAVILAVVFVVVSCPQPTQETTREVPAEEHPGPENQPPTVEILAPTEVYAGTAAAFEADCTDPDGDPLTYDWQIGADTYDSQTVEFTPAAEGAISVSVTVSDGELKATDETDITVLPKPWEPEPHTLYILDADGGIYSSEVVTDPARWSSRVRAYESAVELYNRDRTKPGPYPYSFAAGEAP